MRGPRRERYVPLLVSTRHCPVVPTPGQMWLTGRAEAPHRSRPAPASGWTRMQAPTCYLGKGSPSPPPPLQVEICRSTGVPGRTAAPPPGCCICTDPGSTQVLTYDNVPTARFAAVIACIAEYR